MSRLSGAVRRLEHHPGCTAPGWTILLDRPIFDGDPHTVTALCWTCQSRVTLDALTPAENDPGGNDYDSRRDIPPQHRSRLYVGTGSTRELPAGHEPERVAGHLVHIEAWLWGDPDSAYEWLVATRGGDVLGVVSTYSTVRMAERYRWGTYEDAAGHGDGFKSRDAAARALIRATRPEGGTT